MKERRVSCPHSQRSACTAICVSLRSRAMVGPWVAMATVAVTPVVASLSAVAPAAAAPVAAISGAAAPLRMNKTARLTSGGEAVW